MRIDDPTKLKSGNAYARKKKEACTGGPGGGEEDACDRGFVRKVA